MRPIHIYFLAFHLYPNSMRLAIDKGAHSGFKDWIFLKI
jgi:hypothetical protein